MNLFLYSNLTTSEKSVRTTFNTVILPKSSVYVDSCMHLSHVSQLLLLHKTCTSIYLNFIKHHTSYTWTSFDIASNNGI